MTKKEEKVSACESGCACKEKCCCCKIAMAAISVITLIVAIFACVFAYKTYNFNVLSLGGKENFQKMQKFYQSESYVTSTTDSINNYIGTLSDEVVDENRNEDGEEVYVEDETQENTNTVTYVEDGSNEGTLSAEEIATLKVNGVLYGSENAKITILEFADASCGYCKRQVGQDQTVDAVMAQYPNDVNMMFKNMPIFNETAAQAMACAEDYLSAEAYHQYVISVFQADDATSVDSLANLAAAQGADATTIANCVNNGDKAEEVKTTMSEGSSFGISGTPSSVIINNESGKFVVVPGAYPVETFVENINTLLS